MQSLSATSRRCTRAAYGFDPPTGALKRTPEQSKGLRSPVGNPTEPNDHSCSRLRNVLDVAPDASEIPSEGLGGGVAELTLSRVHHLRGSPSEPVAQPLIGKVSTQAIVGRRGDDPSHARFAYVKGLSAVRLDNDGSGRPLVTVIPLGPAPDHVKDADPGRTQVPGPPEPNGIPGLRCVRPLALIGEIGVRPLRSRSVKSPQDHAPKGLTGIRCRVVEQAFAQPADRVQDVGMVGKLPELPLGNRPGRFSAIENLAG